MKGTRFVVLWEWCELSHCYRQVSELPLNSPNAVLMYINNWRNAVMQGKGNLIVKILDYANFNVENQTSEISEANLHQMIIKEDWKDKELENNHTQIWHSVNSAAALTGLSTETILKMCESGQLKSDINHIHPTLVHHTGLEEYLKENQT